MYMSGLGIVVSLYSFLTLSSEFCASTYCPCLMRMRCLFAVGFFGVEELSSVELFWSFFGTRLAGERLSQFLSHLVFFLSNTSAPNPRACTTLLSAYLVDMYQVQAIPAAPKVNFFNNVRVAIFTKIGVVNTPTSVFVSQLMPSSHKIHHAQTISRSYIGVSAVYEPSKGLGAVFER